MSSPDLLELDCWPRDFDGSLSAAAAVKNLTSELIGRLCGAAQHATRPAGHPPLTRYAAAWWYPAAAAGVRAAEGRDRALRHEPARSGWLRRRASGKLIAELAEAVLAGAPVTLEMFFRPEFESAPDDRARLRVVIDQIASLTDTSAMAWHHRLHAAGT